MIAISIYFSKKDPDESSKRRYTQCWDISIILLNKAKIRIISRKASIGLIWVLCVGLKEEKAMTGSGSLGGKLEI